MLYTIGLIEKYEVEISAGTAIKGGPHLDQQGLRRLGGWVWQTQEEAHRYLISRGEQGNRAVYGVMAEWEIDAIPVAGEPTRCLTRDALVVRLGGEKIRR